MKALIDGDILRYETGFASETGWRAITEDPEQIPPFEYVKDMLELKLLNIVAEAGAQEYKIFVTEGKTFRFDIAKTKPYKGSRKENKPWHFQNLSAYMKDLLPTKVVTVIEADDALAIEHLDPSQETILCSRDKDLRQVPGNFYSWELGAQPSWGPVKIDKVGHLTLKKGKQPKLTGSGLAFFCAQCLMGDAVDNIPGLPGCGPVKAYEVLKPCLDNLRCDDQEYIQLDLLSQVEELYEIQYGHEWVTNLMEQGQLLWMTRRLHEDGSPVLWELGMTE